MFCYQCEQTAKGEGCTRSACAARTSPTWPPCRTCSSTPCQGLSVVGPWKAGQKGLVRRQGHGDLFSVQGRVQHAHQRELRSRARFAAADPQGRGPCASDMKARVKPPWARNLSALPDSLPSSPRLATWPRPWWPRARPTSIENDRGPQRRHPVPQADRASTASRAWPPTPTTRPHAGPVRPRRGYAYIYEGLASRAAHWTWTWVPGWPWP